MRISELPTWVLGNGHMRRILIWPKAIRKLHIPVGSARLSHEMRNNIVVCVASLGVAHRVLAPRKQRPRLLGVAMDGSSLETA